MKGKRVFVSGGAGVIGLTLVEHLYNAGAIILVGDLKPRPEHWPKVIQYRQGDLNLITLQELESFKPEIFFHLAATFERSSETYEFWEENARHNVHLSTYLMGLLKDMSSLKRVVFASSYLIYDKKLYQHKESSKPVYRLSESDPINPRNLTGSAKLNHEIELQFLNDHKGAQFTSVSARIYRSYGRNSRDVISRWIRSLLKGETLEVYNKEGRFDYIFADDVAHGLIKLAQAQDVTGIINLGRDNARSIKDVLEILKRYFPNLRYNEHLEDVLYEASQANMDLFRSCIGWAPSTDLEQSIPEMISFEKKQVGRCSEPISSEFQVLVTSISRKVSMLNALKVACKKLNPTINLFGADIAEQPIGSFFVDQYWKMPPTQDDHVFEIIDFCNQNQIQVIFPSRDGELLFWAKHKTLFKGKGIEIMIASEKSVSVCVDKLLFYKACKKLSFPVIPTYSFDEFQNIIFDGNWVVKERYGAGSMNMQINVTKEAATEARLKFSDPIFQPFIAGEEFSIDVYFTSNHSPKGAIVRKRTLVVNGESQITTTVSHPELESICMELGQQLQLVGHNIFQAFVTRDGDIQIIECNARFGGASSLSIAAGLDSFYWFLLESRGVDISDYPFIKTAKPLTQVRYASDKIVS